MIPKTDLCVTSQPITINYLAFQKFKFAQNKSTHPRNIPPFLLNSFNVETVIYSASLTIDRTDEFENKNIKHFLTFQTRLSYQTIV